MAKRFFGSIARGTDLERRPFRVEALPREAWRRGDFVVADVVGAPSAIYRIELASGRRTGVMPGQQIVGAFGNRAATHDCCGAWEAIGPDLALHQLTGAGLLGKATSVSPWSHRPMELVYRGHVVRGEAVNLRDFAPPPGERIFARPTILIAGTSMSAGKTLTARAVILALKSLGQAVTAAKLTGAAGHKDALGYGDAGADDFLDYVDAGMTDTVCAPEEFEAGFERLLGLAENTEPDIFVGEIGASPLEPYNGLAAMQRLEPMLRVLILVAGDGYAARGFLDTVPFQPDMIVGPVANTEGSAKLTADLTGRAVHDLSRAAGRDALLALLRRKLDL